MARSPSLSQQGFNYVGSSLASPSVYSHAGESIMSPTGSSSYAASTATLVHPSSSTSLSGLDFLRDLFHKRLNSLAYLKRSLMSKQSWFQTIHMGQEELAAAFDNDRMRKRTVRYTLLGLSLSSILDISNPSDMARAIVSLTSELDTYSDETILSLASGPGSAPFGSQRPKMRSFFKSANKSLKRSAATQAISEFGAVDSTAGPSASIGAGADPASYLMTPNIPFQLDFFQTFFTLCDMLTEVYYKMLSFLPRDPSPSTAPGFHADTSSSTSANASATINSNLSRTTSPPPPPPPLHGFYGASSTNNMDALSSASTSMMPADSGDKSTALSAMTQELLLKADAKIKKTINQQVKEIDVLARQMIKDELASLDPLMKSLGMAPTAVNSAFLQHGGSGSGASTILGSSNHASNKHVGGAAPTSSSSGLPSNSSLPFSMGSNSQFVSSSGGGPIPGLPSSVARTTSSHFRPSEPRTSNLSRANPLLSRRSQDSLRNVVVPGHHQFNLAALSNQQNHNQNHNLNGASTTNHVNDIMPNAADASLRTRQQVETSTGENLEEKEGGP